MSDSIPPPPQEELLKDFAGIHTSKLSPTKHLKMGIVGKEKAGKSWFSATAPKPIYIFDFDGRSESLRNKPGFYVEEKPAIRQIGAALSIAQYHKEAGIPNPATWVFDSVTNMCKAQELEIYRLGSGMHRNIRVSDNTSVKVRQGYDATNAILRQVEFWISEFSALGNLIFVFHEIEEKDRAKSTAFEPKYTGMITAGPQYLVNVLSSFNEVFRAFVDESDQYKIQCKRSYNFPAATSMLLDPVEEPDIQGMLDKHYKRVAEAEAAAKAPKS